MQAWVELDVCKRGGRGFGHGARGQCARDAVAKERGLAGRFKAGVIDCRHQRDWRHARLLQLGVCVSARVGALPVSSGNIVVPQQLLLQVEGTSLNSFSLAVTTPNHTDGRTHIFIDVF